MLNIQSYSLAASTVPAGFLCTSGKSFMMLESPKFKVT